MRTTNKHRTPSRDIHKQCELHHNHRNNSDYQNHHHLSTGAQEHQHN